MEQRTNFKNMINSFCNRKTYRRSSQKFMKTYWEKDATIRSLRNETGRIRDEVRQPITLSQIQQTPEYIALESRVTSIEVGVLRLRILHVNVSVLRLMLRYSSFLLRETSCLNSYKTFDERKIYFR